MTTGRVRIGQGLIPAWAGKTSSTPGPTPTPGAHPRVGGENSPTMGRSRLGAGSSPRGRGKPGTSCAACQPIRLIPAWAGKTRPMTPPYRQMPAHPRVGGENHLRGPLSEQRNGSSPRGRGKLLPGADGDLIGGLIPAWAGKTSTVSRSCRRRSGSSPRGRGKLRPDW